MYVCTKVCREMALSKYESICMLKVDSKMSCPTTSTKLIYCRALLDYILFAFIIFYNIIYIII